MLTNALRNHAVAVVALLLFAAPVLAETHWELQAVDSNGVGTFSGPATVTGVILNNHENMLDPTGDFNTTPRDMGAQWQVFIQPTDPDDHAGTACWMGQNYGNLPWVPPDQSYNNEEWTAEMNRLNYDNGDPDTGHHFRAGDLVQVTANFTCFYGGKTNINEGHSNDPARDFTVSLTTPDYGLPVPEVITLAMVINPDDGDSGTHEDIFDANRTSGGEYYQGRYVRINGLTMRDSSGWGQEEWGDRICIVTDGEARLFPLRMPRVDLGDVPTGEFDVIGIFNQESGSGSDGTFGYELYVTEVIPEPACLSLLGIGAMAMLRRRRNKP